MKLDHIAITVKDIEKSIKWYTRKFNASVLYKDETWGMLEIGGTKIALTLKSQHPPHFAFSVDSVNDIPSSTMGVERPPIACFQMRFSPSGDQLEGKPSS